jgi:hypothetical protein
MYVPDRERVNATHAKKQQQQQKGNQRSHKI